MIGEWYRNVLPLISLVQTLLSVRLSTSFSFISSSEFLNIEEGILVITSSRNWRWWTIRSTNWRKIQNINEIVRKDWLLSTQIMDDMNTNKETAIQAENKNDPATTERTDTLTSWYRSTHLLTKIITCHEIWISQYVVPVRKLQSVRWKPPHLHEWHNRL